MFEFGIKDIIDIVCVAMMLYYLYRLMKESRSLNVFIGIIVFVVIWLFVSQVIEMRLLGSIMDKLVSVGVVGLIVLFQEEIRKFLYSLGTHQRMRGLFKFFSGKKTAEIEEDKETIMPIVMACMDMSKGKVGTLPPEATAANFAKLAEDATSADKMRGLVNLVLQAIGTMSVLACRTCGTNTVVLTGALTMLPPAHETFELFTQLYGVEYIIPENATFATAIGAALYSMRRDR